MARAPKESETERRTYILPKELVERMRAYQTENNITSEVEVARKLLDEALQSRDNLDSIMRKVSDCFNDEKDLRSVAQNILSGHILVKYLIIDDDCLQFGLKNGEAGSLSANGHKKKGSVTEEGQLWLAEEWRDPAMPPPPPGPGEYLRNKKNSKENDDEIPF